jgi:GNAT superfamily N-acetyltransferase
MSSSDSIDTKFVLLEDKIQIHKLSSVDALSDLDCTENDGTDVQGLQKFICQDALKHQENCLGVTYLLRYDGQLVGYFTVANAGLYIRKVEEENRPDTESDLVRYPAVVVSHLAVNKKHRKCGFGSYMLKFCIGLAKRHSEIFGCRYLILRAREALAFYERNGFIVCQLQEKEDFKLMAYQLLNT